MQIPLSYNRRHTCSVSVGTIGIGSSFPIRIQTMANTSTDDVERSLAQARRCISAGAELLRFTTQGTLEVEALSQIRHRLRNEGYNTPLVADVHFRADVADTAAALVEKVRINPGNYAKDAESIRQKFKALIGICKQHGTALRIGVNHGSLSARMMEKYGDTPQGMTESCMEFLRIAREEQFNDIVLSIKSSDTHVMVQTVRLLVQTMDKEDMHFPLHLGVTEAGEGEDGRLKSAVGIGALLADGIGDTVRVSLSEEPEAEIPVARELVDWFVCPQSPRYHNTIVSVNETEQLVDFSCDEPNWNRYALYAAAESGRLLWDYHCSTLLLHNNHFCEQRLQLLAQDILQAARVKIYKTEFTSCPGCGRTMFDLQKTVADIKQAFADRNGQPLKIAVMGCIVNGPGEMADADYGYVGAGRGKVSLYKGKECIIKNIPQEKAVETLLQLIENNNSEIQ
jgi:(E)-4-hydroxy-3-methylbut-2-enyl-diphosphate synthase